MPWVTLEIRHLLWWSIVPLNSKVLEICELCAYYHIPMRVLCRSALLIALTTELFICSECLRFVNFPAFLSGRVGRLWSQKSDRTDYSVSYGQDNFGTFSRKPDKQLVGYSRFYNMIHYNSQYKWCNVGDIMGGCETRVSVEGSFTPMERVVLTANGNLQRIMRWELNW